MIGDELALTANGPTSPMSTMGGVIVLGDNEPPLEERLAPDTQLHGEILSMVRARRDFSKRHMETRYADWNQVREHLRLFIDLNRSAKKANKQVNPNVKEMPFERAIVVPMSYAILQVLVTQLMSIFAAREPMFQVRGRGPEDVANSKNIETLLHYDMLQTQAFQVLYSFLYDANAFGNGIMYDCWEIDEGSKTEFMPMPVPPGVPFEMVEQVLGPLAYIPIETWGIRREFNRWKPIDVFNYWGDPRVPLQDVQRGEFVGHRFRESWLQLKMMELPDGPYFNLDEVTSRQDSNTLNENRQHVGIDEDVDLHSADTKDRGFIIGDHLQIKLIPRDYKLSSSDRPEKWLFTIANDKTIIRCHKIRNIHDEFSYSVGCVDPEFHSTFSPGAIESLDTIQRFVNWSLSSHLENITRTINNQFIYSPALVEEVDVEYGGPGEHIRMTDEAVNLLMSGQIGDVRQFFSQVQVQDVTGPSYMNAINFLHSFGMRMLGVNDPVMAMPTDTTRTATEIGTIVAKATDRVSIIARLLDSQAVAPAVSRAIANLQQFRTMEDWYKIVGETTKAADGSQPSIWIGRNNIAGRFDYVPNSGIMPEDPARQAQVYNNAISVIGSVPQLQQPGPDGRMLDMRALVNEMLRRGGLKNLDDFYIQVVPDEQLAQMAAQGQAAPAADVLGQQQGPPPPGMQQ